MGIYRSLGHKVVRIRQSLWHLFENRRSSLVAHKETKKAYWTNGAAKSLHASSACFHRLCFTLRFHQYIQPSKILSLDSRWTNVSWAWWQREQHAISRIVSLIVECSIMVPTSNPVFQSRTPFLTLKHDSSHVNGPFLRCPGILCLTVSTQVTFYCYWAVVSDCMRWSISRAEKASHPRS